MSRISKWKLEKTKVKVVFRLQFHATHVPQTGWDKLFISFIPADTGKPTAKTTKSNVRNGSCKWGDPIYETTRLLQDSKTKQYDEKLYKFVVSMGSSRASILGEATINLADYVDASKPTIATIPLHGCNFGTILHITVQLLTSKTGFREFEQQRELREKGLQSGADIHSDGASGRISSSEGVTNDQADKVSARIKFKADASELSSLEEEVNVNEEYADLATGFDGSSNTSGSLYAEKHDTSCTQELGSVKCTPSGDLYGLSHFQSPHAARDLSDHQNNAQGSTGSAHGWGSNNSMDNELAMASEENNRLRGSLELAESSLFNLKLEVSSLQSVADELGAETQKLSHELVAEISSAEELAKEVSSMKSECLKFKDDIIGLKDFKLSAQIPLVEARDNQVDTLVRSMQLQFLNGISVVESKIRELQKKTVVPHDGDTKLIHLELEALLNFLLDFKLGNGEVVALPSALPSERADLKKIRGMSQFKDKHFESGNGFGLDLCPPESVLQHLSSSPPVSDAVNPLDAVDAMKGQIFDLVRELDEAKIEKEALTRKMDQMECYYEALIHELEENQKRLLGELQLLRNEHSTCLYALSVSKTEVESLHEEMNQQMLQSAQERHDLEAINLELERRATTSEAALRRARLNYSIAVDKLQKDLELLSSQVTSMFESNESLIKQALPSQPVSQVGRELVQNPEDDDVAKSTQFQNQNMGLRKRSTGGDILLEDLKRSVCMQEDLYKKVEEELVEMYSISLNLDIYSKALEESLCEANADLKIMNGKTSELVEELTSSTASQNHLMLRLQKTTDEIHILNEYKSSSISQCSEMALQNQLLEDKLLSVSEENILLSQKLIDWESTLSELRSYQSKYAACSAENAELSLQLKQEALENEKLMNDLSHLKEESKILKAESDKLVSSKINLEESIKFVQDKLANLFSYYKQFGILAGSRSLNLESVDIKDAVLQLEEVQHSASVEICQLMEENRSLKSEKASADVSLSTVRSEILLMKQKFKSGVQDIVMKLDVSNALVDRLQTGIESLANKLHLSSEIEEKFAEQNELLLADFALLEDQMQKLTGRNGHLAREISNLDTLAEELGRSKLEITEVMHDKKELTLVLMDKTDESMKLSREVNSLKEDLKTLRDELHDEKASTYELERKVQDLTLCLSKDQDKLVEFEHQKAELIHSRELASHLQIEKSRLDHLLHQQNELMEVLKKSSSYQASLESQLSDMHDYSLATDVQHIYVSNQYKTLLDELLQKLASSEVSLRDLQKRYHDTESMLNHSLAGEAKWRQEKDSLLASLESLRSDLEVSEAQNKFLSESNNEIKNQLEESKGCLRDLQKRHHDTESMLNLSVAGEANWRQEKDSLLASLESLRSDLEVSEAQNKLLSESNNEIKNQLEESNGCLRDLQKRHHVTESMLNHSVAGEANWRQEKDSLLASLESLRSDLEVSEAQNKLLSESNTEIKNQLEESNGCLRDLQKRHHDTESMLNHSVAGEANWRQEKDSLVASLESLRSDLEVSEARNKLLSESNSEIKNQLEESNGCLRDLQKRHLDTESMLNHSLAGEANWRQETDGLLASVESLRSDLEVSEAQSKLLFESNNDIKNQLEESNGCLRDLQKRYLDTESMLNHSLAGETNWRQEKDGLLASLESLRSDLEVSEAQNKLLSESNNEIKNQLEESKGSLRDLQKRYHDNESMLNHSLAGEDNWRREKDILLASLESLRSDLEVSEAQNKLLSESNNEIRDELEESKRKLTMIETHFSLDSSRQASDVLRLQNTISDVEDEMSNLILSKDELEVLAIVLKGKVNEQTAHITLLEGYKEELMILRSQFNELSKKLAEQVLRTEEFKNLSVHLKELKDKAEAECVVARDKRENEVPSAAGQDSLRIAFIKEQYETKVQELKQQLSISKKHGEEMLMRLQDAIDEIENRKKSEAVSLKKNEELSTRLSALEAELMSVLSEKREKSNAYDRTKAELECALLSLECCKEEKENLGASLLEFEAEKSHLTDELNLVKGQLEDLKCLTNLEKDESGSEPEVEHSRNGSTGDASPVIQRENFISIHDREIAVPTEPVLTPEGEIADSTEPVKFQIPQDAAPYPVSNGNTSDANNEHLGAQKLRSSIERLHEELEKMKNENTIFDIEHDVDTDFEATQREITQLRKANEELRSMFPLFDEISSGGNALDRVLALEIELAEALKVKNKSNSLFQSSFLKQHSDEEAVFKSFRDINELIKEMLELKGRHAAVEAELREMHNRYSQLSLQFAEVEGERQKLKMTLKNVRASKRLVPLSRSSSDNLMDHPS